MLKSVLQIESELRKVPATKKIIWDLSGVSDFDSAGVLLFIDYLERFQKETEVEVVGYSENQKDMYDLLHKTSGEIKPPREIGFLEKLGRRAHKMYKDIISFITFTGHLFYAFFHTLIKPTDIRFKETVYHIHQSGFNAIIIIALTSFLVGMVIS